MAKVKRTKAQQTALKKFWESVPWDRMRLFYHRDLVRTDDHRRLCPIESAGGCWPMHDGNLGLHPVDRQAIIDGADNYSVSKELAIYYRQNMIGLMAAARAEKAKEKDSTLRIEKNWVCIDGTWSRRY
jgi:hypothetical protein